MGILVSSAQGKATFHGETQPEPSMGPVAPVLVATWEAPFPPCVVGVALCDPTYMVGVALHNPTPCPAW